MRNLIPAVVVVAAFCFLIYGPALATKLKLAVQGQGSTIVLPHLVHLDQPDYPSRAERRRISTRIKRRVWRRTDDGAVTLAQAKLNAANDIEYAVIDEFRKGSFLFDAITFDDVVNPAGGGATWTYGYRRKVTKSTAQFRAINSEYAAGESTTAHLTVDLKVFGGKFEIDRVLAEIGATSEVTMQMDDKIEAAITLFHDTCINGDTAVDANSFDGLDKALAGTSTEFGQGDPVLVDLSTSALMDTNKDRFVDLFEEFLGLLDGAPTFIGGNSKIIGKIRSIARRLGYFNQSRDEFGRFIDRWGDIPLVDLGEKPNSSSPVSPIYTEGAQTGLTDIYAVRMALDGFHGISLSGRPQVIRTYLPDLNAPGVVKAGEVEAVAAVALKKTKAAAVMRHVKVQ